MVHAIRAVYENGHFRLLDPVNLPEGEEIQLMILSDQEKAIAALSDLLIEMPETTGLLAEENEDALLREIESGFQNQSPLSETIIEERHESM